MPLPVSSAAEVVAVQFASRPTLDTVTRQHLTALIKQRYPTLSIDLSRTQVATPHPDGGWTLRPLMPAVLSFLGSGADLDLRNHHGRSCFLSDIPPTRLRLPTTETSSLEMSVIDDLIKALPQTLPLALQDALASYWGEAADTGLTRWLWVSDTLADNLRICAINNPNLEVPERELLEQLLGCPDRDERLARYGAEAVHAYCPQAILKDAEQTHSVLSPHLLLVRALPGTTHVLTCQPGGVVERRTSVDNYLDDWGQHIALPYLTEQVTTQRLEPEGNIFDTLAALILNQQLEDLGALDLPSHLGLDRLRALCLEIGDPSGLFAQAPTLASDALKSLRGQIPAWLLRASAMDRTCYGRYSLALASAKKSSSGRTYLSDIPDIRTFTTDALLQQLKRDEIKFDKVAPEQSRAAQFQPDDLQLTFSVAAGYPGGAGFVERVAMSLTDLAIKNLQGQPRGQLTVQHRNGHALPTWLTPDYINGSGGLIEQVDIGKTYPALLNTRLLGDSDLAHQRTQRFAEQTVVHLPLLALELCLKGENGVSRNGARYVAALMGKQAVDRQVEGRTIVIRHLALLRKPQATPDVVNSMYIIEPEDALNGPHILYRPLYPEALREFASRDALLAAIALPGELQASVLTWLSDGARPIYDNGGFQEPHYPRFGTGDEFSVPEVPEPAALTIDGSSDELLQFLSNGQLMQYLYGCNARALIDQADRDSVSNHESRWGVLLEGASLLFNTLLLPLARGPLMLTGWLLSLMSSAGHDIPALNSNDPVAQEQALVDLLLNVGMLLLHLAPTTTPHSVPLPDDVKQQALRSPIPRRHAEQWPQPPAPAVRQGPVALENVGLGTDGAVFDFSFSSARDRLNTSQRGRLARLRAPRPEPLTKPATDGPRKGLYPHLGDWYALIDAQWYLVSLEPGGHTLVVDPFDRSRLGPLLKNDGQGHWSLDLRLRLRGGMPLKRIATEQKRQALRKQVLADEAIKFIDAQTTLQKKADDAEKIMNLAATNTQYSDVIKARTRKAFDQALHTQNEAYKKILDSRKERDELGIPLPAETSARFLQHVILNARARVVVADMDRLALYAANADFLTPGTELTRAVIADPHRYGQFLKDTSAINERQISALELKDQYLLELYNLGRDGFEGYNRLTMYRPAELGALTVKFSQLQNLRYLSIKASEPGTSAAMGALDSVVEPMNPQVQTHAQFNNFDLAAEDRLSVLDSLSQHYGQALDALQGIAMVHADSLHMEYFQRIQTLVEELYQDVVQQLAGEIKPDPIAVARPPKRVSSGEGKPQKKVIKTRKRGVLIGDLKPEGSTLPIEVVEVHSEKDDQLLGSYSLHDGQWDEIRVLESPGAMPPPKTRALQRVKGDARNLMKMLTAILGREEGYARVSRFPIEVQESLQKEAERFTTLAAELERAFLAQPEPARLPGDQDLINQMRTSATTLITRGRDLRIQRTLELPPTDSHVTYLLAQDRVQMARLGSRIAMHGERADFIQEYAVNNKRGSPLWYAHFHYATVDAPKSDYTVAHLKTKAQRKESYDSLLAKARTAQGIVDIHRGVIGPKLAQQSFLPLAT